MRYKIIIRCEQQNRVKFMYIRTVKAKSRNYVVIVRGYRDEHGKVKQKTIKNLGFYNTEEEREKLYIIGRNIIAAEKGEQILVTVVDKLEELSRSNWGADKIVQAMIERFQLDKIIEKLLKKDNRKIEFEFIESLKFLVINRLTDPTSKLASYNDRANFDGFGDISLHNLYKTLDELARYNNEISKHLFNQQKKISKNMDVVLFDVTTLYFESKISDDLRDFGFSKDCKFSEVQVVLSLVVNTDGRPISYKIFQGNMFEGKTLLPCLKEMREEFDVKKVTIVADRGIGNFENLSSIREAGFDYIIAARIRSMSKERQGEIMSDNGYEILDSGKGEESLKCKVIKAKDSNILCVHSSKRARKDANDREKMLERAEIMMENKSYKRRSGAKKYINFSENDIGTINYEKLENDAKFDGYYAIHFSQEDILPQQILSAYHNLWKIEESFRTMKHFLQTRPMFHWTEKRIIGHIALNFIALIFEKDIELSLDLTQNQIRRAIASLQRSILSIGNERISCYAKPDESAISIMNMLRIKMPKNGKL